MSDTSDLDEVKQLMDEIENQKKRSEARNNLDHVEAYGLREVDIMSSPWLLGWRDRGHGHGDCVVLISNTESLFHMTPVIEKPVSKELGDHIISLHNKHLGINQ